MKQAYLYDGLRTPFGRYAGAISSVRPDDLVAGLVPALLARSHIDGHEIEDVILGCVSQSGEDARNVARHAVLASGLPVSVPGLTVNRLCGSGLAAVVEAARAVKTNEGNLFLAGGVESMSRAPFVISKSTTPFDRQVRLADATIGSRFSNPTIVARYGDFTMPQTADNLAAELQISREASDQFAAASQAKFHRAFKSDFFVEEIAPVTIMHRQNSEIVLLDEQPRPATTLEALSKLKTLNPNGVVTAGNASGINDGAALLLIGGETSAKKLNRAPMVRLLSAAVVGVEPRIMGVGPAYAIPKALERAGLHLRDMDVVEINEAFAAQVLGCLKLLQLDSDDERVNPNGGAIAVGHPLGASGARLVLTAARQLQRISGRYAVVSLCIGVGQGIALVMERIH